MVSNRIRNIEPMHMTLSLNNFISSCNEISNVIQDLYGSKTEVVSDDGSDYSVVRLKFSESEKVDYISDDCLKIKENVQTLIENYCKTFKVDFQLNFNSSQLTGSKLSSKILDDVVIYVSCLHRLFSSWSHDEYLIAAQILVFHGTRPIGNTVLSKAVTAEHSIYKRVTFHSCWYFLLKELNPLILIKIFDIVIEDMNSSCLTKTEAKSPFLIGVAGGTACGKSTVCKNIIEKLGQTNLDETRRQVVSISQDSFYRELNANEKIKASKGQFNFDHPDAFDEVFMYQTLTDIQAGKTCTIPVYNYKTNSRSKNENIVIYPADVVIVEGILAFYFPAIRDLFHMKLFVDTDSDTRLARRVPRDINERGRDLEQVLNQYMNFVKPAFEEFCLPTKKFADIIIPRGAENFVAIDLIVQHIRDLLNSENCSQYELSEGLIPTHSSNVNASRLH